MGIFSTSHSVNYCQTSSHPSHKIVIWIHIENRGNVQLSSIPFPIWEHPSTYLLFLNMCKVSLIHIYRVLQNTKKVQEVVCVVLVKLHFLGLRWAASIYFPAFIYYWSWEGMRVGCKHNKWLCFVTTNFSEN